MRKFLYVVLAVSCNSAVLAQQFATSFKSVEVSPGIYMLDGVDGFGGGNVGLLVGNDYVVLIDDAMTPTVPALIEAVTKLAGRPVDFVINTHVHGDHVGGNKFVTDLGAVVVAHDNIRKRMIPDPQLKTGPGALPVLTFSENVTFHVNGHEAFVFHIKNAHTDGDAAILFRDANVIAAGDVMFNYLFPFIDLDNGGSVAGYIAGQKKLIEMADDQTAIIPGHGPVANKADLQTNLDVLIDSEIRVKALVDKGMLEATSDYSVVSELDTINVCVPTPLRKTREPDLSYVIGAVNSLAPHMHGGQLLILESTTYPGTTEEIVLPILRRAGLEPGRDVELAVSPERTDPGNVAYPTRAIPKVVGALTAKGNAAAHALYGRCIDQVVTVSSPKVAEMVKLLENTFRSVNIALVNELAMLCDCFDIDVWEVIEAAATKPFGFMPFYPGPGLGGHCIPVDPQYLTWKARAEGFEPRFIELASQINAQKPRFVVDKVVGLLNDRSKALRGSSILALGVAYKRDVADVRESPSIDVMSLLIERGADVAYADPFVDSIEIVGRKLDAIAVTSENVARYDLCLLLTDHTAFDLEMIAREAVLIVDTRNAFKGIEIDSIVRI